MKKINGTFEVKLDPTEMSVEGKDEMQLGRLSIDKKFSGDLSATSKGEMLSARTPVGSAGYVAIEQVTGTLESNDNLGRYSLYENTVPFWNDCDIDEQRIHSFRHPQKGLND